jgi:hypothetical protein
MIKPDMIPKECFVAYQRAFKRGGGVGDAIAAALNAWPSFEYRADVAFPAFGYGPAAIILPLPQEARDE